jgi:hypothetical protein
MERNQRREHFVLDLASVTDEELDDFAEVLADDLARRPESER